MRSDLATLVEILENQRAVYSHLLELGYEKGAVISRTDSVALDHLVAVEQELVQKAKQLEEHRKQLTQARAGDRYPPGSGQDNQDNPGNTDCEISSLQAVRRDLQHILHELDLVNRSNHKLLENQLKLTRSILGRLIRAHSASAYGSDGSRSMHLNQSRNVYNQLL